MLSSLICLLFCVFNVESRTHFPGWFFINKTFPRDFWMGSDMVSDDGDDIMDAALTWNLNAGTTLLRVFPSSSSYRTNVDGMNTITLDMSIPGASTSQYVAVTLDELTLYDSDIQIGSRIHGNALFNVALHEFGHCLGLMHSPEPGSIMNYTLTVDIQWQPIVVNRWVLSPLDVLNIKRTFTGKRNHVHFMENSWIRS